MPKAIKTRKEYGQFHFGSFYDVQILIYLLFVVVAGLVGRSIGSIGYKIRGIVWDRLLHIQLLMSFANIAVVMQNGILRQAAFLRQIPVKRLDMAWPQFSSTVTARSWK